MLYDVFDEVYMKFKINFYKSIFRKMDERIGSLSATEAFAVESIYALGQPTISEFADFMNISQPNATYKVNSLIRKGYVEKINSKEDKREYHLAVTQKFLDYYGSNDIYRREVMERIEQYFSPEEVQQLERMLSTISKELM